MARKNNKAFGSDRERAWGERQEAQGYVVVRSAGSNGPVDLVCARAGSPLLFDQLKGSARSAFADFPPAERRELLQAAARAGAVARLIWWPADRQGPRIIPAECWPPS